MGVQMKFQRWCSRDDRDDVEKTSNDCDLQNDGNSQDQVFEVVEFLDSITRSTSVFG